MSNMLQELGIDHIGVGQPTAVKTIGKNELETTAGKRIKFDTALVVPPHRSPEPVASSDLAKNGWTAPRSPASRDFRSEKYDNVYVIGDVAAPSGYGGDNCTQLLATCDG